MTSPRTVSVDIGIIEWIESVLCMDLAPSREVIESLHDREQAHYDARTNPSADDQLVRTSARHSTAAGCN